MPVILELINQPDPADLADLEKIYADYPLPPVAGLVDWLFDQRDAGKTLIAGRFNDRLLAALWLARDGDCGRIEHLCVRALTRRRGTARQLLQLLIKHAPQLHLQRLEAAAPATPAALWQGAGFVRDGEVWAWPR
jgi:GNAT superfamily N-acetyltransferase